MADFKLPRYALEIDEEGFPMFDGLRVQDEKLSHELFHGMRRLEPGNLGSVLVSVCEGELCWIKAFDAPLVAQSIEEIGPDQATWVFPGALKVTVPYEKLEVDAWNRYHAWIGPDAIPAVLSRKAQATLLGQGPLDKLHAPEFRKDSPKAVDQAAFWSGAYQGGQDRWEMREANPVLRSRAMSLTPWLKKGARVLVPGAGRGNDAAYLEKSGFDVTAVDFAPEAVEGFKKNYPAAGLHFEHADIFNYFIAHPRSFDAVFEHTIFVAIHPARRAEYLAGVERVLKPSGIYFGVFFIRTTPGGPPFGLTQWELKQMLGDRFEIKTWEIPADSVPERAGQELWVTLQVRK